MSLWKFNTVRPGDRTRESQVEKFFNSQDERATPLIREGIQNSLDADPDDRKIRVRITLGVHPPPQARTIWQRYAAGLQPHLDSMGGKLPDSPKPNETMRFLVFEDFETSGLGGDSGQWEYQEGQKNGFFEFFRAEGVSTKEGSSRGRHGVGKFVFMAASRVRTVFGLTKRQDDQRELLMGTTVLRHHTIHDKHYMPDGWFGRHDPFQELNVLPIEDVEQLEQFKQDFRLSRTNETGLSILVPWLDDNVTRETLIHAVIEGYFYPLMKDDLCVEIVDEHDELEVIDHATIRSVVARQGEAYVKKLSARLELAAAAIAAPQLIQLNPPNPSGGPKWSGDCFTEESIQLIREKLGSGELVALLCPTRVILKGDRTQQPCHFAVYLRKDLQSSEYDVHFIRQGILVSEVKSRKVAGLRALVVIHDGPLAKFLGDAENPAHTEWQSERVKHYSFNKMTIDYVTNSLMEILHHTQPDDKQPDPLPMKDLFFVKDDLEPTKTKQKKARAKPGTEPEEMPELPKPPMKSYAVTKIEGGFVVRAGQGSPPESLTILMAYDTHKGNAFKKYHPADFQLDKGGVNVESIGVEIKEYDANRLKADVLSPQFEIKVQGFDINRDLVVDVHARKPTAVTEEDDDAA
jgi:hypothetical protein